MISCECTLKEICLRALFNEEWKTAVVLIEGHPSKHLCAVLFLLELNFSKKFGGTNTTYHDRSYFPELGF